MRWIFDLLGVTDACRSARARGRRETDEGGGRRRWGEGEGEIVSHAPCMVYADQLRWAMRGLAWGGSSAVPDVSRPSGREGIHERMVGVCRRRLSDGAGLPHCSSVERLRPTEVGQDLNVRLSQLNTPV